MHITPLCIHSSLMNYFNSHFYFFYNKISTFCPEMGKCSPSIKISNLSTSGHSTFVLSTIDMLYTATGVQPTVSLLTTINAQHVVIHSHQDDWRGTVLGSLCLFLCKQDYRKIISDLAPKLPEYDGNDSASVTLKLVPR